MQEEEHKSRIHIHLGGLFIIIIILLILFKVDIKSKIQSPKFQENIIYIEEQAKNLWFQYLKNPIDNLLNKGVEKAKEKIIFGIEENINQVNIGNINNSN